MNRVTRIPLQNRLRIAQVAPLYESVPPKLYGGTERVVAYLTEELLARGHEVTLFASADSHTRAALVAGCSHALRLAGVEDGLPQHLVMLEEVYRRAAAFDVVHFHCDYIHFPRTRSEGTTHVTTLHGRLDAQELVPLYDEFSEMPVVAISDSQRSPLPHIAWRGVVHHGLPEGLYRLEPSPDDYLAFLGRISPEKGVDRAIEIARRCGLPLRIAAKLNRSEREYYETSIVPRLGDARVELVGEIGDAQKQAFLGKARALVFPIGWPEPFGVVMIEALACGTPVIAFRYGAVPEVLEDGLTGFIADDVDGAVAGVKRLGEISRARCRRVFEERFTAARMARDYETIYRREIARARPPARPPSTHHAGRAR
jgi:glycosyltransferase involved in cell wall biosynthesis